MLQNAYFLAKIGADTAENEQHFADKLPKIGNYPTGQVGLLHRAKRHGSKCRFVAVTLKLKLNEISVRW